MPQEKKLLDIVRENYVSNTIVIKPKKHISDGSKDIFRVN